MSYSIFCVGHPLIDMQVRQAEDLLTKYNLKANDAILADVELESIYEELIRERQVFYVAGGAAQNTARGAAYILPPNSVVFAGCVGDDELAEQLRAANKREGVLDVYQVQKGQKTGACAVLISKGHHRSLVTTLRAAKNLDEEHLWSPTVAPFMTSARVVYIEGFMLTHRPEISIQLARKVSEAGKVCCVPFIRQGACTDGLQIFVLNLAAPYIPRSYNTQIQEIIPYCDIIISNEAEAEAWAASNDHTEPTNISSVAKAIALLPKANVASPRIVIVTHGAQSTTVVSAENPDAPKIFPVQPLKEEEIVDTNAAGDAFAGGFLGAYVSEKSIDVCIETGHRLAAMCVGQVSRVVASDECDYLILFRRVRSISGQR
ncbi:Ribokinase-like protein [Lentinula detonsa]|uniref:Adenosine kinase n=1 Tax=Lentinula detonsa TaxID=2804962 RepID=A0AA38Q0E6_9AGAR|nr:Ribokinase-like protein [Lentinula detonsa]